MFVGMSAHAQIFTQTFVDRCTGEVKIVTANFTNGPTAVAFYNKVRIFTPQEATNGTLQAWLLETYNWWNTLSPCSQATQQTQQAQQAAQNAQQAAQAAQSAASSAASAAASTSSAAAAASSAASTTTNVPNTTSTNQTQTSSTSGQSSTSTSSGGESGSGTSSGGGGSSESKSETTKETKGETKNESKEESSGESTEESGGKEGGESEESSDGKDSESEESDSESDKKEVDKKEKKKIQRKMNPMLLGGDVLSMQSLTGRFDNILSVGLSQTSLFGDVSYGATIMLYDNLRQASLGLNTTKVTLTDDYQVDWVESYALTYSNNFGVQSVSASLGRLKPMGKKGTFGVGLNYTSMFGKDVDGISLSLGYNFLYTNSFKVSNRVTYSPAFIFAQIPLTYSKITTFVGKIQTTEMAGVVSKSGIYILSNSFDIQLTRRFKMNFGYTGIYNSTPGIPYTNSFAIGSKVQF